VCSFTKCESDYSDIGFVSSVHQKMSSASVVDGESKKLQCCYCGSTEDVEDHDLVPSRYGVSEFCRYGGCFDKYSLYAYGGDVYGVPTNLKYGLPYSVTGKNPKEKNYIPGTCDMCGKVSTMIMENVCMDPEKFPHRMFCRNNKCCREYIRFVDWLKNKPIPHCLKLSP
jgi:hypothetical protein